MTDHSGDSLPDCKYYFESNALLCMIKPNGMDFIYTKSDTGQDADIADTVIRVNMQFAQTDAYPAIMATGESDFLLNYYLPHTDTGLVGVKAYKNLYLPAIYAGVDVYYLDNEDGSYTTRFIIDTSSAPDKIRMEFTGQDSLTVDGTGNLWIHTQVGELAYGIPVAWQDAGLVDVEYEKSGASVITFDIGNYNGSDTLYIDLESLGLGSSAACEGNLVWSTYFGNHPAGGSRGVHEINDVDAYEGDVYVIGHLTSPTVPNAAGAVHSFNGIQDAFLAKFVEIDPSGERELAWWTYYGSNGEDYGRSLAVSTSSNYSYVYATGEAGGTGLPVKATGTQASYSSGSGFVARVNQSDGKLDWGTYFGGSGDEEYHTIDVHSSGSFFVGGYSNSTTNFDTKDRRDGSYYYGLNSGKTGFILEFNSNAELVWATKFGAADTRVYDIDARSSYLNSPLLFLCGQASGASGFPQVQENGNSFDNGGSYGGGNTDGFITKMGQKSGQAGKFYVKWSSYIGGAVRDNAWDVMYDANNSNVYLSGVTKSISSNDNFPVKADNTSPGTPFNNLSPAGNGDAYLARFNMSGEQVWTTFYGGLGHTELGDKVRLALGDSQVVYLALTEFNIVTATPSQFITPEPLTGAWNQAEPSCIVGDGDIALAVFDKDNNRLWASYFGRAKEEKVFGCDIDLSNNKLILVGHTTTKQTGNILPPCPGNPYPPFPLCNHFSSAHFPSHVYQPIPKVSLGFLSEFDMGVTPLGISDASTRTDISVMPNPSSGYLHVSSPDKIIKIRILNVIGQVIWESDHPYLSVVTMDVSHLSSAVYVMEVLTDKGYATVKLVKQ